MADTSARSSARAKVDLDSPECAPASIVTPTFDELYTQYFDFVWRIVRRFGVSSALVEDAAQDTFVVVHRRLSSLRPEASPKSFVFAIAVRVAHDYRRTARRKGTSSFDECDFAALDESPYEQARRAQAGRLVRRFLASLNDTQRAAFVLSELEGLSAPEISELLRVKLSTVYTRVRAVRARFVDFLDSQERSDG